MTYEELKKFILEDMKPNKSYGEEKNYQPVMIRTLNQNDGKATKEQIIEQLQKENPSKQINSGNFQTVSETLINHKAIEKKDNWYYIPEYDTYTPQNKAWITMYCDEKINESLIKPTSNKIAICWPTNKDDNKIEKFAEVIQKNGKGLWGINWNAPRILKSDFPVKGYLYYQGNIIAIANIVDITETSSTSKIDLNFRPNEIGYENEKWKYYLHLDKLERCEPFSHKMFQMWDESKTMPDTVQDHVYVKEIGLESQFQCWIWSVTSENWEIVKTKNIWASRIGENIRTRISPEDKVIFYVQGTGQFKGIFEFSSDWYDATEPVWSDEQDSIIYQSQIKLKPLKLGSVNVYDIAYQLKLFSNPEDKRMINLVLKGAGGYPSNNGKPIQHEDYLQIFNSMNEIKKTINYWKISPGEQASDWDTQRKLGLVGIGWNELGDLTHRTFEDIHKNLRKIWPQSIANNSPQFKDFLSIKKDDIIIANKGKSRVVGIGRVVGDYQYRPDLKHAHVYPVEWFDTNERQIPSQSNWFVTVNSVSKETYEQILSSRPVPPVLSKEEFEELVKKFDRNRKIFDKPWHWPYNDDKEIEEQRMKFISKFPPDHIENISLQEYALGLDDQSGEKNRSNFSYFLERGTQAFGHIAGNARKFGLYFKREEDKYWYKYNKYKSTEEALNSILQQIKEVIDAGRIFTEDHNVGKLSEVIDAKENFDIQRQVRSKILALYYPNTFLTITSRKYLDLLLDYFAIPKKPLRGKLTQKQFKLIEKKHSHAIMRNWSMDDYSCFLWNAICANPELEEDEDEEEEDDVKLLSITEKGVFDDGPLPFPSPESLQKAKQIISEQILIDDTKIEQIISTLVSGKNILLTGPVGSGKTHLATILPRYVWENIGGYYSQVYTATADWTTQDVIGGIYPKINPDLDVTYNIQKGCIAETVSKNWLNGDSKTAKRVTYSEAEPGYQFRGVWLVIDEFNRANIDRAFGQLFTALEYRHLQIPTTEQGKPFQDLLIPEDYRIIGTLNTADKHFLHSLSDALKRRFAIIEISTPSYEQKSLELYYVVKKGIEDLELIHSNIKIDENNKQIVHSSEPETEKILNTLYHLMVFLREIKPLGTALLISMFRFMVVNYTLTNNWQKSLDLALTSSVIPQLENLPYWSLKVIRAVFCQDVGYFFKNDPEIQSDGTENYRNDFEALVRFLRKVKHPSNTILKRFRDSSLTDEDYKSLDPWADTLPRPSLPNFREEITKIIAEKGIMEETDIENE